MLTDLISELSFLIRTVAGIVAIFFAISFFNLVDERIDIRQVTKDFAENVQKEGYIDKNMYEQFMRELSIGKVSVKFDYTDTTNDAVGREVTILSNERDILKAIYNTPDEMFKMKKNATFEVEVYKEPDLMTAILQAITNQSVGSGLITRKGGLIYHVAY